MEYNWQLKYYLQDTTRVVEAVQAWNSVVVSANGDPRQDEFGEFEYIDGSGVAIAVIDTGIDGGRRAGPPRELGR